MIGQKVTGEDGKPLEQFNKLAQSAYQPSDEVKQLYAKCQRDYSIAWSLQHRPFEEFDGLSLLERSKRDQQTFGAYVGAQFVPAQKRWRWRGRKNTARNKLIGLLAHMIAGMLYPVVHAQNAEDEEDKLTAQVMKILVEEHLRKAGYQMKFLYMALSALVNPAVFVEVDYLVAYQRIKERLANGQIKITEAIDQLMTGLNLNIVPVDQLLLSDFYTGDIQRQPYIIRVNRISWDTARKIYGDHPDFKYVEAGKTRIMLAGQENATLFDVEWTEADRTMVQEITCYYRDEDLEVTFVGGVFVGSTEDVYNTNQFKHRRMSLIGQEWKTIPIYPFAKSGFEPIDPSGRFAYYKSGAFKEYWDDASVNKAYQLLQDGMYLEVIKPIFMSGVAKADSVVIAPGSVTPMPKDANVTPWSMQPSLPAAMNVLQQNQQDLSGSTLDPVLQGQLGPRQTAYAVSAALTNAKIMLGLFSFMMADLIKQVGELTVDCVIQHTTQGDLDATVPEDLKLRYKTVLAKTKDKGKDVTNKIIFTDSFMGKMMSKAQQDDKNWDLWEKAGGQNTDQRIFEVNPYRFARTTYSMWVDPDAITSSAIGLNKDQKMKDIQMLTLPFVYPYTDPKAIADEVIEEFGGNDPDRFKSKGDVNGMMNAVMGGPGQGGQPGATPSPLTKAGTGGLVDAPDWFQQRTMS